MVGRQAPSEVAFSFGYFLLATQEKSDSVAEGDRPLVALKQKRGKALRLKPLAQNSAPCPPGNDPMDLIQPVKQRRRPGLKDDG